MGFNDEGTIGHDARHFRHRLFEVTCADIRLFWTKDRQFDGHDPPDASSIPLAHTIPGYLRSLPRRCRVAFLCCAAFYYWHPSCVRVHLHNNDASTPNIHAKTHSNDAHAMTPAPNSATLALHDSRANAARSERYDGFMSVGNVISQRSHSRRARALIAYVEIVRGWCRRFLSPAVVLYATRGLLCALQIARLFWRS